MAAGLLTAQSGGWTGAPSGDGGASVPDAWPPSGDAAFAGLLPGYAFAQVQDSTPPTFVSSGFDGTALTITFSETIAAANVDPAKIHVRESGSYAGGITLTAGELDTSADADTISFALTESNLAAVKGLDTPELTIEPGAVRDTAGNPIVGTFDVSTATYIGAFDVTGSETSPRGMAFSSDGAKMFVVGSSGDAVHEYDLSAPFDVTDATHIDAFDVSGNETSPRGMAFSSDGAKMFVAGSRSIDGVHEYALTAPFDVSTATHAANVSVATQDNSPQGVAFSSDGSRMFIAGDQNNGVYEYALGTPFDVTSYSFTAYFNVTGQDRTPEGVAFSNDGARMFVVGSNRINVYEYALTAPFDVSTASPVDSFDVSEQDSTPTDMAFSSDGAKMFVVGNQNKKVYEYALSSVYPIAMVTNTPPPDDAFVTTWEVETSPYVIHMPVEIHTGATATIDWGDGSTTDVSANGTQQHTYATAGNYTVAITGGLGRINLGESASADKLASLDQWGDIAWTTMKEAFRKATGMVYNATDAPDLSGVTSMQNMFRDAEKFDGNLSGWNVSGVANMDGTFRGASVFDGDLSAWDTSGANDTRKMFQEATSFNGDISSWNTTGVAHMDSMFRDATAFNQTLSGWDVSGVANMASMLEGAAAFNGDLSGWNVSSVTDMFAMLSGATDFNGDLSGWNVSGVTDMAGMFWNAPKFNADISGWNVSAVTDMFGMFRDATAFNSDISGWNVSGVTDMEDMFRDATAFNSDISGWNVSSVTDMTQMLTGANGFSQNLGKWYITLDSTSADLASDTTVGTILPQNDWLAGSQSGAYGIAETHDHEFFEINGTSLNVKDGADYTGKTDYAVNITSTHPFGANNHRLVDVTVTDTSTAFKTTWNTAAPNEGITIPATGPYDIDWGDGTAESVTGPKTHTYADAGNHAVTVSGGLTRINLGADPDNAAKLASIDQWGDMEWTTMEGAFQGASNMAYGAADAPDLSGVANMTGMFGGSSAFNGNLSSWDVSGVTDMANMFESAENFDGDISSWNVSSVTDMDGMFRGASVFNGDITAWNVSSVTNMKEMFLFAVAFDQDISGWDVSNVTDMEGLFLFFLNSFSHNLGKWHITLDSTSIDLASGTTTVGTLSPQNSWFASDGGAYGIAGTHDHELFEIVNGTKLSVKADADYAGRTGYTVSITSTYQYGQNNHRVYNVTVTDSSATFVTTWEVETSPYVIHMPVEIRSGATATIDWGDGSTADVGANGTQTHTYADAGNYTVAVTGGLGRINLGESASADKLKSIDQWGSIAWTTMKEAFRNAVNMTYDATDAPDLSGATSMQNMFRGAEKFDGDLSGWDVSGVANMDGTFRGARAFDGDLSAWDTSGSTDMRKMFRDATTFNGDISSWNTTGVVYMDSMFQFASSFNGDISSWNTSSVTKMQGMFGQAISFNQNLSDWDVSSVTNMEDMFNSAAAFNGNVSGWNVSSVTNMFQMFSGTDVFNQDLSGWDVSSVTDMEDIFHTAVAFDQNLGNWYIVLNNTEIDAAAAPGVVGTISAQNQFLDNQNPTYDIADGRDSFEIVNGTVLNMTVTPTEPLYAVTINSTGVSGDNNHRAYNVTVTYHDTNSPPMVGAGADQEVVEGDTVALSGTVTDVDTGDILTYSWTHDSDLPIAITGSDSLSASFVAPNVAENTTITVTLTVNDGTVDVSDALQVTITDSSNSPPTVEAGVDQEVVEGATAALSGTVTDDDPEDDLTYSWTHDGALPIAITGSGSASASFVAPSVAEDTTITVTLTVNDGTVDVSDTLQVTITVSPGLNLTAADSITNTGARELDGARGIATFESGGSTYAAVAAYEDDGVQILDVTNPFSITAAGDIDGTALELDGAEGIAVFESGGSTYAAVAAYEDDGVQILDITDPYNVTAAGSIDNTDGTALELEGAWGIATFESGGSTYAAVASRDDHGVQILNITDPHSVTAAGSITDPGDHMNDDAIELRGARGIAVFESGGGTYAAVAAQWDDGVQILNITDPYDVTAADGITDTGDLELKRAYRIATFGSGGSTYAAVTAEDDHGVQILNITDPSDITAAGSINDTATLLLKYPTDIATFAAGGSTYAAVASRVDDGVQILNITDPSDIAPAGSIADPGDILHRDAFELNGAWGIAVFESGGSTYAAVASDFDDGVQILRLAGDGSRVTFNSPPTVEAGPDQTVGEGDTVTLSGTVTDDDPGDALTYRWTHDGPSGITLADPAALSTSFTAPSVVGNTTFTVTLTVNDETADVPDTLQVTITDSPGLNLPAAGSIDGTALELNGAQGIVTFKSGGSTYAAVASREDDGVQILDITDPSNVTAAGSITDPGTNTDALELNGASGITTFKSGGSTYAAVASFDDGGVQILNITDPYNVTAAGNIDGTALELEGARGIATFESGGSTYAAVAAYLDQGVQILDITDPYNVTAADNIGGTALELHGASGIATFKSGGSTYAAVASFVDRGVQILNITDPSDITAAGSIDWGGSLVLRGAEDIAVFKSGGSTYAAVAAYQDDAVQMLDMTDPYNVTAAGSITDTVALELRGARGIATFESGGRTYAAVAAYEDDGVQMLDITDPYNVTAAGDIDGTALELEGARGIATFESGGSTYAAVAAFLDDGVQIIRLTGPVTNALPPKDAFVTTWEVETSPYVIHMPVEIRSGATATIDWGDGSTADVGASGTQTHTYAGAGNYTVAVTGGLGRINLGESASADKLASLDQWGDMEWTTMEGAFSGAYNMAYRATDAPDLSGVANMTGMFSGASAFDGNLSGWDVSGVTDMAGMFQFASDFNGNVSGWDVSGVTDMAGMFSGASAFDGNVSGWDVSRVTDMANMFGSARDFNADLSGWDVSRVTDMYGMFWGAEKFDSDLSGWNVSGVTDMESMFQSASAFNGSVSGWNVSGVTDMTNMFWGAAAFNGNVSGWNVSSVDNMNRMFFNARAFNGNVSGWNVSGVTDMTGMFYNAAAFNADLSGWNVSRVTDMTGMFQGATLFRQNLGTWFVVPADTLYDNSEASLNVTTISAQNPYLDGRTFTYGIGGGHDFDSFNMTGSTLMLKSAPSAPAYKVNVTAVGSIFGTNNHRILDITVDGVDPNVNPVLDDIAPQSVAELVRLEFNATATDTDTLVFSLVDPYPDGASIGGNTGTFAWTPGEAQDGNHTVTVRVSDGRGGEHSRDVQIEVREVNLPPELAVATAHEATELEPLEFNATATDPDTVGAEQTPNDLTFSLDGEPDGAAINSTTGAFSWTPGADQNGTHTMDVRVSDGIYTDSEAVTVTVADSGPGSLPQGAFVTTWKADTSPDTVGIPVRVHSGGTVTIHWGDGSNSTVSVNGAQAHTYQDSGRYQVAMTGDLSRIIAGGSGSTPDQLLSIDQWGDGTWGSMKNAFKGATNMEYKATDTPDLSGVTDMDGMFRDTFFTGNLSGWDVSNVETMNGMFYDANRFDGDLSGWNVSTVTNMNGMFQGAHNFNQPLSSWDTSGVTDMRLMFHGAQSFNGNISSWDTSGVENMREMFRGAISFNGTISGWNVSGVTNMRYMFNGAGDFNQDISGWNVSRVTNMEDMFSTADSFQQNLGKWYVVLNSTETGGPGIVGGISAQNTALDNHGPDYGIGAGPDSDHFNVTGGNLLNLTSVDSGQEAYSVNVTASGDDVFESGNNWRLLNVTVTGTANAAPTARAGADLVLAEGAVFALNGSATDPEGEDLTYLWSQDPESPAVAFNDTSSPTATITLPQVTENAEITLTLTASDTSSASASDSLVLEIRETGTAFLTTWSVTGTGTTVSIPTEGSYDIVWGDGRADTVTSDVTQEHEYPAAGEYQVAMTGGLSRMDLSVPGATPGKLASIDQWGDIRWDSMERAFHGASNMEYNAADSPDLSRVTDMRDMFYEASSFNGNLSGWNVSSVNRMDYMFYTASSFNGNLSSWDVSSVNRMDGMFSHASSFNGNLSSWDVSSVNRMEHMFSRATDFNGNISSWNASSVNRMDYMFSGASSFNGDLSGWNVSSVTDMTGTFSQASDFNQPLDDWNVSSVTRMDHMFNDAPFFNGNLPSWDVSSVNRMDNMFSGASDFNGNISSWNVSSVTRMDSMFSGASDFNGNISSWNVSSVTRMNGMFSGASSFNGNIPSWNVSSVISMSGMFNNASSFDQNLGKWYVVLNSTATDGPGIVGGISAQNAFLNAHNSTYGIGTGPDSDHFEITGGNLLNLTSVDPGQDAYTANVTASGDDVFESGNNWRLLEVTASSTNLAPTVRAGPDLVLAEGAEFALGGSATDPNGDDLTYSWSQSLATPAVAFDNASSPTSAITLPQVEEDATVTLTLTASDTSSASASDSLTLSIRETGSAFLTTWSVTGTGKNVAIPTEGSYGIVWGDGRAGTVTGDGTQSHDYPAAGEYQVAMTGGLSRMDLSASGATPGKLASIDQWGGIGWTSMEGAFQEASSMEYGAADAPDLSGVTNMGHMFEAASSFNGNISGWDVSSVTDMNSMFIEAPSFNQSLNAWDVSSVTDMNSMFAEANSFNGNISGWDVSSVTLMDGMFHNAPFNQPLNAWNVSSVTGMTFMFSGTTFNQNISAWDVSSATGMDGMFSGASSFNQPLNAWNVSSATGMGHMFSGASSFNGNVSSWNVSSVTGMDGMFEGASSFNGNISAWDVSRVTEMSSMFQGASSFDQNLGSWYVVPADTAYDASEGTLNVTTVSAQNAFLDGHEPEYGIGAGGNPTLFNMTGGALMFEAAPDAGQYSVNITASGDDVFGTGNHRVYNVTVTGAPVGVTDGTPPEILAARATARNAITVTFSEDVDADSTGGSGWSITGNDAGMLTVQSNTDPAGSSSTMNLTLSGNLTDTAPDLSLAYAAPATGGITDTASPANPLGNQTVEVGDGIPPVVESARATSPTGITLTMSEIVNSSGTGPNGFAVSTTGTAVTVSSIGGSNSDTLVLTLSGSISDADTITVSYGTGDVRDLASNPLAGFSGRTVDTSTDITPPTFVSATYSTGNGVLTSTFSEPIGGTANRALPAARPGVRPVLGRRHTDGGLPVRVREHPDRHAHRRAADHACGPGDPPAGHRRGRRLGRQQQRHRRVSGQRDNRGGHHQADLRVRHVLDGQRRPDDNLQRAHRRHRQPLPAARPGVRPVLGRRHTDGGLPVRVREHPDRHAHRRAADHACGPGDPPAGHRRGRRLGRQQQRHRRVSGQRDNRGGHHQADLRVRHVLDGQRRPR